MTPLMGYTAALYLTVAFLNRWAQEVGRQGKSAGTALKVGLRGECGLATHAMSSPESIQRMIDVI